MLNGVQKRLKRCEKYISIRHEGPFCPIPSVRLTVVPSWNQSLGKMVRVPVLTMIHRDWSIHDAYAEVSVKFMRNETWGNELMGTYRKNVWVVGMLKPL